MLPSALQILSQRTRHLQSLSVYMPTPSLTCPYACGAYGLSFQEATRQVATHQLPLSLMAYSTTPQLGIVAGSSFLRGLGNLLFYELPSLPKPTAVRHPRKLHKYSDGGRCLS